MKLEYHKLVFLRLTYDYKPPCDYPSKLKKKIPSLFKVFLANEVEVASKNTPPSISRSIMSVL